MATRDYTSDSAHTEAGWHVSWGALFAGLAIALGISALLTVLGTAIGISVADVSNLDAVGSGFGIGAALWMVLTTLAATFAGAAVAAVLAGDPDTRIGALHGLTVWALSTFLILVLLSSGVGSAFNLAGNVLQTGASAVAGTVGAVVPGGGSGAGSGQGASGQQDGGVGAALSTTIQAALKRQAASVLSGPESGLSESEVSTAISEVSASDLGRIASALVGGETERARDILGNVTDLSEQEINGVVETFRRRAEQAGDSQPVNQAQQWLGQQLDQAQQSAGRMASDVAGQEVSATEAERAIEQLSPDVLAQVAGYLVTGNTQQAKDTLTVQTNLDERQVNAILDGAQQDVQRSMDAARQQATEVADTIGDYLQAAAWSAFLAMLLGAGAGLAGGAFGARSAPVRDPETLGYGSRRRPVMS